MYGSWYWGSQASSWIFWWAFARLCRLTSTPHGRDGALGVGGAGGRWTARGRVFVPRGRDGCGRRGPRGVREAAAPSGRWWAADVVRLVPAIPRPRGAARG